MTKVLDFEMVQWLKVPKNLNSVYGIHNAKGECVLSVITEIEYELHASSTDTTQKKDLLLPSVFCASLLPQLLQM